MINRVVVTGIGILSSIGNNKKDVLNSLINIKTGICFSNYMKKLGIKSQICGRVKININKYLIDRNLKFMNISTIYSYISMNQAIKDSNLKFIYKNNNRLGLIVGSSINSPYFLNKRLILFKKKNKINFIGPYLLIKSMSSNISACLSTYFKIKGLSYSLSSACTTTSNCIINAYEKIKLGKQDIILTGGGDELSLELIYQFDSMNILSKNYNKFPSNASRPYDINRDGFVISEGSGIIVLESLESAIKREVYIYAEIVNCSSLSDGYNILLPSKLGIKNLINKSIKNIDTSIDYINTHSTSTILGDLIEIKAIKEIFNNFIPYFSSTKSITGHSLGSSGVHELIYSILMLENNFIFPNTNVIKKDFKINNFLTKIKKKNINTIMSNNFGFGGNNTSIIIKRFI